MSGKKKCAGRKLVQTEKVGDRNINKSRDLLIFLSPNKMTRAIISHGPPIPYILRIITLLLK